MSRLFWELGTRFAGRGRCREVKIKANVWIFGQDERSGRCREVAVSKGLTVHHLQCFLTLKKINTKSLAIIKYQVISPSFTVLLVSTPCYKYHSSIYNSNIQVRGGHYL